ncbi:BTAD domain-containing putative transcriptional regulator [Kribbella sp. NPDC056861]|uniref:AfsR/SARP family transcriptional regulator n=1 Tax=Kribbella sp. NPDC056861 TaxID=3154857 RepID=UPI003422B5BF
MEYRLLGPVEVVVAGKPVALGRRQERLLLALLVLSANSLVPAERLISLLWQDKSPDNPARTLQVYVSRLRKALPAGSTLDARDQGYQLTTDVATIDVHRFREAVRQADLTADPTARAELLRAGLELWRGPALVDVASAELRHRLCADLEEGRLNALESRIEADLESGLDSQLVVELAGLVADHPGRERLVAAQAIALYRAGRTPDALESLRAAKRLLAEELGLDPGPRLQEIEAAILHNDQDLLRPQPPRDGVPRQLPSAASGFVGRTEVAERLTRMLTERQQSHAAPVVVVSAIAGIGGVGKTALAIQVANRVAAEFPDGQLFLDLRGYGEEEPMTAREALGILLRSLGLDPKDVPDDVAEATLKYRTVLAGRRVLIVLDNVARPAVVEPLLPGSGDSAVIVTSRAQLTRLTPSGVLQLDVLEDHEALELLEQLVGAERVRAEPDATQAILTACGNLPLAVRVAGARLAARPNWPISHLAERIADQRQRLEHLDPEGKGLRAVLASSLEQLRGSDDPLDRRAAQVLVSLGIPDSPRSRVLEVARLTGLDDEAVEDLLERLVDSQLLMTPRPRTYRLHDLVWSYAREEAEATIEAPAREAALQRLLTLYSQVAWQSVVARNPQATRLEWAADLVKVEEDAGVPTGEVSLDWLDSTPLNSAVLQGARGSSETRRTVLELVVALGTYDKARREWREAVGRTTVAVEIAEAGGDQLATAFVLGDLGIAAAGIGDFDAAIPAFRQALSRLRALGEFRAAVAISNNLTRILQQARRFDEGIEVGLENLELADLVGDISLRSGGHLALSLLYAEIGDTVAERRHLEAALADGAGESNPWRRAYILASLGTFELRNGRTGAAVQHLRESVAVYGSLSQPDDMAETVGELGEALLAHGEITEAISCLQIGLDEATRARDEARRAVLVGRLAEARAVLGEGGR